MNSKRLFQIFILASACILLCFGCTRGAEQTDVPADTPQAVQTPVGQDEDVVTILPADGKDNAPATVPPEVEAPQPTPKPTEAPSKQTPAATAEPTATAAATPKATAKPTSKPSGKKDAEADGENHAEAHRNRSADRDAARIRSSCAGPDRRLEA